jgi:hypothetical protein
MPACNTVAFKKCGDMLAASLRLLQNDTVSGTTDELNRRTRNRLRIGFAIRKRHKPILVAPYQKRRTLDAVKPAAQFSIV